VTTTEVTQEPATGELVPYASGTVEEYRPRIVMAPDEAKALDDQLRASMKAVLRPDVDYGKIPGANKDSLLKPGAEKLLQWFGFGHTLEQAETERDADGRWYGVTYRCIVTKGMPDGRAVVVATCDGYAGYDEDRFYTSAEQAEAKERANAERYHRSVNPLKFAEYRAPRNSVIKMAQKRAMVGAALQATSASSLFTQDMEDMADPATAATAALAPAGRAAIGGLPPAVRKELDAWFTTLHWPGPDAWTAEQWCVALIKAGKLSVELASPQQPVPAEARDAPREPLPPGAQNAANGNGQQTPAPGAAPREWFDWALGRANAKDLTKDEVAKLWTDATARNKAGTLPDDYSRELKSVLTARLKKFKAADAATTAPDGEVVDAVIVPDGLDPADPWAASVEAINDQEDGAAAMADAGKQLEAGHLTQDKYDAIVTAISVRLDSLSKGKAA